MGSSLHEVRVATTPPSRVVVGDAGLSSRLAAQHAGCPLSFIVADRNVHEMHSCALEGLGDLPLHLVEPGEASKSIEGLAQLLNEFAAAGLDRHARLLSFGGGVTSDLAGLAAALYMRGIDWISAPTTLLAQVDASVGGKTAINIPSGKNLVGAFHQPTDVEIDVSLLSTLSQVEWRSGLGEVLKAALLGARTASQGWLFETLEQAAPNDLLQRDAALLTTIVQSCVEHKAQVVAADFKERGPREQLNLGHTFAHAIEHVAGFGTIPHGIAVAAGLDLALAASQKAGLLVDSSLRDRSATLAAKLGLPRSLEELESEFSIALPKDKLEAAMARDKKAAAGAPRFILPCALGSWTARAIASVF